MMMTNTRQKLNSLVFLLMHTPIVAEEEGVWPTVGKEAADLRSIRGEELTTRTRSSQEAIFDFFLIRTR
jgi:hypothetical protein